MEKILLRWLHAWVQLADGVVSVLTLGFVWSNWSFKYIAWAELRRLNKLRYGLENEECTIWNTEEEDE